MASVVAAAVVATIAVAIGDGRISSIFSNLSLFLKPLIRFDLMKSRLKVRISQHEHLHCGVVRARVT